MGNSLSGTENQRTLAGDVQAQPEEVEELLQQVLEQVGEELVPCNIPHQHETMQEIVLDIQVNNVRYTLTRSYVQPSHPPVNLSPREQEIVRLVAKGHPNKVIAKVLEISPWTVSTHLRRVFAKLGVNSRAEMVARVLNEDLLLKEPSVPMPVT